MGRLTSDLGPIKYATNITTICTNNINRPWKNENGVQKVRKLRQILHLQQNGVCPLPKPNVFVPIKHFRRAQLWRSTTSSLRIKCNFFQKRSIYFPAKTGPKAHRLKCHPNGGFIIGHKQSLKLVMLKTQGVTNWPLLYGHDSNFTFWERYVGRGWKW